MTTKPKYRRFDYLRILANLENPPIYFLTGIKQGGSSIIPLGSYKKLNELAKKVAKEVPKVEYCYHVRCSQELTLRTNQDRVIHPLIEGERNSLRKYVMDKRSLTPREFFTLEEEVVKILGRDE